MGKILVTGGAGYIGSFTVKTLLNSGYEVVVLDNLENGHKEAVDSGARLEVLDLKDKQKLDKIFKNYQIEAVIDFAAYLDVAESMTDPVKYLNNNVRNFIYLLDAMVENNCRFIIKSSTAATYGNPTEEFFPLKEIYQEEVFFEESQLLAGLWKGQEVEKESYLEKIIDWVDELFELNRQEVAYLRIPTSIYGITKLMDEIILKRYEKNNVKSIALRYFNVSGAAEDGSAGEDKPKATSLMSVCILHLLEKVSEVKIFGDDYPTKDGTGIRDYIHPLDLASGHLKALQYLLQSKRSNVFNLGTGKGYSVLEVIAAVEKAANRKISFSVGPRRAGDLATSYADPNKAKELLNWTAQFDLNQMADTAWKWHSTHPDGYQTRLK